ncbi:hypothetical protein BC829DRAFT_389000 [Chytridium lagenaria]|nr:hypothetical protein BC829DRAFT_389000 [Chytridium lagenaria]
MKNKSLQVGRQIEKTTFELLGDRKAYYETSQWAIRQNKEEIGGLRARLKKNEADYNTNRMSMTELEKLDHRISEFIKRNTYAENRLDKAMIKYNEAQSIRKTYEHIVKRLQEERLSFDNQLANFEKALKKLARFEQQINEERKQREKDLQTRKELVKQKMEINDKLDRKSLQLDDPNAELGLLQDPEKKMAEYEEIMRLIKEATGVSNINEVIAKFQSQGDTHNHLSQLQKQNEARSNELKVKKASILAEYEDHKYTGESKNAHSQRIIEEFQTHLQEAKARMFEAKHKYERMAKLLTNTKAGIQHLTDKLDTIQLPDKAPKPPISDTTIKQVLDFCSAKLEMLTTGLEGKELPEAPQPTPNQQPPGEPVSILQVSPATLPTFNTRVKLRPVEFEEEILDEEDENDDEYGEVPDRETIKKHTNQMLNARLKTKQAKKAKKKKVKEDAED